MLTRSAAMLCICLTGVLCCALLFASLPARAIEPYQAQSVEPHQATPVKEQQSQSVEPYQADTIPVVTADPIVPVTGQAIALQQAGFLRFLAPEGWARFAQEQTLFYLAPDVPKNQVCALAFLPEQAMEGDTRTWFLTATRGKLGDGVKLVMAGAVQERRLANGALQLAATQITENKDGARMYTYYMGTVQHSRGRLTAYVTSSPELFLQHLPEFAAVQQSLTTAEPLPDGNAPAPQPPVIPEPAKPEPVKPEPTKPAPVTPARLAVPAGNAVEPLTNGLLLHLTADAVIKKFGQPATDDRAWGGGISYAGFGLIYNAKGTEIWHFTLKAGPRLNSGIGVGSTRAEVEAVFGDKNPVTYDQYEMTFRYDGDRVYEVKIDPAKEKFVPYRQIPLGKATPKPETKTTAADFIGHWYGTNVASQLIVNADGSWANYQNEKQGTYTIEGNDIVFGGPILKAWNNGRATLKDGSLQFYWKNPDGSINYFAFIKGK